MTSLYNDKKRLSKICKEGNDVQANEGYFLLEKGATFRVGIVIEDEPSPSYRMELIFLAFPPGSELNTQKMRKIFERFHCLILRGYRLIYEEDGWIDCEKQVRLKDIAKEASWVIESNGESRIDLGMKDLQRQQQKARESKKDGGSEQ